MIERIKTFISHLGISDRSFAISCGITQNTLSRQLSGKRELSLVTVRAIIKAYPEISLPWLFNGIGEMLVIPRQEPEAMDNNRVSKLIDTIAFQQNTINMQTEQINSLKQENERLAAIIARNEKRIV